MCQINGKKIFDRKMFKLGFWMGDGGCLDGRWGIFDGGCGDGRMGGCKDGG